MKLRRHTRIPLTLEIAPLLDVIFLLLMFFLLTSLAQGGIELDLPGSEQYAPSQGIEVLVQSADEIMVNTTVTTLDALPRVLRDAMGGDAEAEVVIKADGQLPFYLPVQVMDAVRRAGATRVTLATRRAADRTGVR